MKEVMIALFLLIPIKIHAGFSEVPENLMYQYEKEAPAKKVVKRHIRKKDNSLSSLMEQDQQIIELLKRQEKGLIIRAQDEKVMALTRVRGILLNSVLAMNVRGAKFIVRITDGDNLLSGCEIRCTGMSFQKRVPSKCDLLILEDEEYPIDVEIWDLDGASGMIADYFYSGEEKSFLTSSLASFLSSTFSVARGGVNTPFGNVTGNNAKNKVLSGLYDVAENAKEEIQSSAEKNLTIAYVNSGKEVFVFFNSTLNLSKEGGPK